LSGDFTLRRNDIDTLSVEAKAQLVSFQFCEAELQRMQPQAAVLQTALPVKQDPLLLDYKSTLAH
tara:strand:+ start:1076 stop:1270 length:195 start_codon:yes stop_codon:yes gene_type:complete